MIELQTVPGWGYGLICVTIATIVTAILYNRLIANISWWTILVIGSRSVWVGLLVLLLLQPVVEEAVPTGPPRAAILLDSSFSMSTPYRDTTRYERGKQIVAQLSTKLTGDQSIRTLAIDEMLTSEIPDTPSSTISPLATSLNRARERVGPGGSIVLVSDGQNNGQGDLTRVAGRASKEDITIHALYPSDTPVDHRLMNLEYNETAELYRKSRIRFSVAGRGSVVVSLRDGDNVIDRVTVPTSEGRASGTLIYTPDETGIRRLQVEVQPQENESFTENNKTTINQKIIRSSTPRVLIVWKHPSWDLRSFMDTAKTIEDIRLEEVNSSLNSKREETDAEQPGYDVVVVSGVASKHMSADDQRRILDWVRGGGGFVMLPGFRSYGDGNWSNTPLSRLLPVEVSSRSLRNDQARPALTRLGNNDSLTERFDNGSMPELQKFHPVLGVGPEARVLAEHPTFGSDLPVLVKGRFGRGRTMAITAGGFWKWKYNVENGAEKLNKFWNQVIGHLTPEKQAGVKVNSDGLWSRPGERRSVTIQGRPNGSTIRWEARGAGIDREGTLSPEGGNVVLTPTDNGTVEVNATQEFKSRRDKDLTLLSVNGNAVEFDPPVPNPEPLGTLARRTGGELHAFTDGVRPLDPAELQSGGRTKVVNREAWDRPSVMAVLIALLTLEWSVRRRNGLR